MSRKCASRPGDFAAVAAPDALEVPPEVFRAAKSLTINNAAELVSYLFTFPTSFAAEVGWSRSELDSARERVVKQLVGHVPADLLEPVAPVKRTYGAFPPGFSEAPEA